MNKIPIDRLDETFGRVEIHKYIGNIIQEHSTNPTPLGSIVYAGLSYSNPINVADIGCGYGRCINHLADIVPKNSEYVGIDPLENNREIFINMTNVTGYNGKYLLGEAVRIYEYPDEYFDLILCNFSLYFFIETLPQIVKKLKKDGLFITITHSNNSLNELLEDLQLALNIDNKPSWNELGSEQVLDNFNAENGVELLIPHFSNIEKLDYPNKLEFMKSDIDKLIDLLDFKKTALIHHNDYADRIKTPDFDNNLRKVITTKMNEIGNYTLNKNDAIFRCRNPICE